jgi:WD40 repeat protein
VVNVWDRAGKLLASLPSSGKGTALGVSPDGRLVAIGKGEGTVEVWDATSMRQLIAARLHQQPIHFAQFTPDGARVITSGMDGRVATTQVEQLRRTPEELARIVKCYVPLLLVGDTALPREVNHDAAECRR